MRQPNFGASRGPRQQAQVGFQKIDAQKKGVLLRLLRMLFTG